MHRFWPSVIKPILDAVAPSVIVEVGAAEGHNTRNLVRYAVDHGCILHVVDPRPGFDEEEMADVLGDSFVMHRTRSLNALAEIPQPDVVLLDGDHNWYTVYHELQLLDKCARDADRPFPLVLLHDVDWPYGRRDLYYEPEAIPPGYRLPHRQEGLLPGSPEPVGRGGLNDHLHNAIYTHSLRNGVRTAVEDFLSEDHEDLVFHTLPGNHGLGILAADPAGRKGAGALRRLFAHFASVPFLQEHGQRIEELRIESVIAAKDESLRRQEATERLRREVTQMCAARDGAERQSEETRRELDRARVMTTAIERRLKELEGEREALAAELQASATARDAAANEAEAATEEAEAAAAEAKAVAAALGEAAERASIAERQCAELAEQLDARADALAASESAVARTSRERDQLGNMLDRVEERVGTLRQRVTDLEAERKAMASELRAAAAAREAAVTKAEVGAAEGALAAAALREAQEGAVTLRERITELEAERETAAWELAASADRLEAAAKAAEASAAEGEASAAALREAEEWAVALRRRTTELEGDREEMASVIAATARALQQADRRLSAAEVVRDQAQATLARLEQEARTEARARAEAEERARGLAEALRAESGRAAAGSAARAELARCLEGQSRDRQVLIEALESHIERTAASRSFRYGHRFFRMIAALSFRRPKQRGSALDLAADVALRLKEMEREASLPAEAVQDAGDKTAIPASAASIAPLPRTPAADEPGFALERALRASFSDRFAALREASGLGALSDEELSGPLARDGRGALVGARWRHPVRPSADVIVCVKDALEDVRICLWSILHYTERPFRLIVVDDGSQLPTRSMLDELARREPAIELLRNEGPDHGYTRAANMGLRASTADYAVLLNSDTVVTPGWLDRLIDCGESDEAIGVVGPLSNAATHQSIPHVKDNGGWAVNEVPAWLTPATMAFLLAGLSHRPRPRLPFVNGFCYAIKRKALNRVGLLDEHLFGSGYCEENDLSVRLHDAGFSLAVADDSYVFHAKSRSYSPEGRKAVAGVNYERFLKKHGKERVASLLDDLNTDNGLAELRRTMLRVTAAPAATEEAFRAAFPKPLEVLFVLHGMSEGSSGGGHSIYQEVKGMQRLGVPARIAIGTKGLDHARAAYPDADKLFLPFRSYEELEAAAEGADVVVATHFTTVELVKRLRKARTDFLPAYYVQDYEPFFLDAGSPKMVEAAGSYTALPDLLPFAKTHWLCNMVASRHGVHVAKVEPSIDAEVYNTEGRRVAEDRRVRVTAMIRPRTPRRQPGATLAVLRELRRQMGDRVEISTFGCGAAQLDALSEAEPVGEHRGVLTRAGVAELLRGSDVFLDLSTYQAFGRTALEAMACGCTAVIPATGGVREFARDGENAILVDSLRPETATAALAGLVDDRDRLSRLRDRAVATARGYSVLKASLAEYALFDREFHLRREGPVDEALQNGSSPARRRSTPAVPPGTRDVAAGRR